MADISTILTEVVLQANAAIASWKAFGQAGVNEFKRIASEASRAQREANTAFSKLGGSLRGVGKEAITLGRNIRRVGTAISFSIGAPLLLLGKTSIDAFKKTHDGLGSTLKAISDNEKALAGLQKSL